jgi:uncharacterized protein YjbI with pentapeptide repeats
MNKNRLDEDSRFTLQNLRFLNLESIQQYVKCDALARIDFVGCSFQNLLLSGTIFGSCSFQDCIFNDVYTRKSVFSGCSFENCKITNSDMRRTEFYKIYFKTCTFLNVNLLASEFSECKFQETKFIKSDLSLTHVEKVKVWTSSGWFEIDNFSSFETHLSE